MGTHVNEVGQVTETLTLPEGKVTGELSVVWLPRGRASVSSDKVRYRDRDFTVSSAKFILDGDEWKHVPENMMSPVQVPAGMFGKPAPPSFAAQVLAAVSEAMNAAWSVDTARTVGREDVARAIREAEMEETRLARELADVRVRLVVLRKQRDRYTED
jgi:hypothetical protein